MKLKEIYEKEPTLINLKNLRLEMVESLKDNDAYEGYVNTLSSFYPTEAHFIDEILQNAEDAKATTIDFDLVGDTLKITHNGKIKFSIEDVFAITGVWSNVSKKNDPNAIGKFGVGFKSVYVYTRNPIIHSGEFHFEINDMFIPSPVTPINCDDKTIFILRLNSAAKDKTKAIEEIKTGLRSLNELSLLFFNNIKEITFAIDGLRKTHKALYKNDNLVNINDKSYLKFSYPYEYRNEEGKEKKHDISFAFELDNAGKLKRAVTLDSHENEKKNGQAFLYLPLINYKSGLYFHVNGPFRSTISRDDLIKGDEHNRKITIAMSEKLEEIFDYFKLNGYITRELFELLPSIRATDIDPYFDIIRKKIIELFEKKEFIPIDNNAFVNIKNAVYPDEVNKNLTSIFDNEDLRYLLNKEVGWTLFSHPYFKELKITTESIFSLTKRMNNDFILHKFNGKQYKENENWVRSLFIGIFAAKTLKPDKETYDDALSHIKSLRLIPYFINTADGNSIKGFDFAKNVSDTSNKFMIFGKKLLPYHFYHRENNPHYNAYLFDFCYDLKLEKYEFDPILYSENLYSEFQKNKTFDRLSKLKRNLADLLKAYKLYSGLIETLDAIYPSKAQFIDELIQNAEDAKAKEVEFVLEDGVLSFIHDGSKKFTIDDIEAITSIWGNIEKRENPNTIGKFGIGFKSVFVYTQSPHIHSGEFHFKITDYFIPETIDEINIGDLTKFVFELNGKKKNSTKESFDEIKEGLEKFNELSLLFLNNINKITYTINGIKKVISKNEDDNKIISINEKNYLKFSFPYNYLDDNNNRKAHEIALCFELDDQNKIIKAVKEGSDSKNGQTFLYLPLINFKSGLYFHVSAPFRSTLARDNLILNDKHNDEIIEYLCGKLKEVFDYLKDNNYLTEGLFSVLPSKNARDINGYFIPIREKIFELFRINKYIQTTETEYITSDLLFALEESMEVFLPTFDNYDLKKLGIKYRIPLISGEWFKELVSKNSTKLFLMVELFDILKGSNFFIEKYRKNRIDIYMLLFRLNQIRFSNEKDNLKEIVGQMEQFDIVPCSPDTLGKIEEVRIKKGSSSIKQKGVKIYYPFEEKIVDDGCIEFLKSIGVRENTYREYFMDIFKLYEENNVAKITADDHMYHVIDYFEGLKNDEDIKDLFFDFLLAQNGNIVPIDCLFVGHTYDSKVSTEAEKLAIVQGLQLISDDYSNYFAEESEETLEVFKKIILEKCKTTIILDEYEDDDVEIVNFDSIMQNITPGFSLELWNFVRSNLDDNLLSYADEERTILFHQLTNNSWVYMRNGDFKKPSEVDINLVYEEYPLVTKSNRFIFEELGFKFYPEFPDNPVKNVALRIEKVEKEYESESFIEFREIRQSRRITNPSQDTKAYLKDLYTNEDEILICQCCRREMPISVSDNQYSFEAVEIFGLSDHSLLKREYHAPYLCLCQECSARYQLVKIDDTVVEEIKNQFINYEFDNTNQFIVTANDLSFRFTQKHVLDIKIIIDKEFETK